MFVTLGPSVCLVVGGLLGGAVLGLVVTAGRFILMPLTGASTGLLIVSIAASVVGLLRPQARRWLPERTCQVSDALIRGSMRRAGFRWGLVLGAGVCTYLVTPAMYAMIGVAVAQRGCLSSGLICTSYGLARTLAIAGFVALRRTQGRWGTTEPGEGLERVLRVPLVALSIAAVWGLTR